MYYEVEEWDGGWRWRVIDEDDTCVNVSQPLPSAIEAAQSLAEYLDQDPMERDGWEKKGGRYKKNGLVIFQVEDDPGWYLRAEATTPETIIEAIWEAAND